MTLDYQNLVKASKIAHINTRLFNIFQSALTDKSTFKDIAYLDKFKLSENKIYKKNYFLGADKFIGYAKQRRCL